MHVCWTSRSRQGEVMERRIDLSNLDLDVAANAISARSSGWAAAGLTLLPVTWVDHEDAWPRSLKTDRGEVVRPMSLGLHLRVGSSELEIVLYAGGWADVGILRRDGDDPESARIIEDYVDLESAEAFGRLLDESVGQLSE